MFVSELVKKKEKYILEDYAKFLKEDGKTEKEVKDIIAKRKKEEPDLLAKLHAGGCGW